MSSENRRAAVIAAAATVGKVTIGPWQSSVFGRAAVIAAWLDEQDAREQRGEVIEPRDEYVDEVKLYTLAESKAMRKQLEQDKQ